MNQLRVGVALSGSKELALLGQLVRNFLVCDVDTKNGVLAIDDAYVVTRGAGDGKDPEQDAANALLALELKYIRRAEHQTGAVQFVIRVRTWRNLERGPA